MGIPFKLISIEDDVSKFIDAQYWKSENVSVSIFFARKERGCGQWWPIVKYKTSLDHLNFMGCMCSARTYYKTHNRYIHSHKLNRILRNKLITFHTFIVSTHWRQLAENDEENKECYSLAQTMASDSDRDGDREKTNMQQDTSIESKHLRAIHIK